jgi:glutathione S-transferase
LAPHILLREIGAEFSLEQVDTTTKRTSSGSDFSAINAKGYVPVLELEDGYLTEGIVIQQYIADSAPDTGLAAARGTRARLELEELLVFLATEVHKAFIPLLQPTTPEAFKPMARDKIAQRFDLLERRLSDGRRHLMGDTFTVADAYCFTLTRWTAGASMDLSDWPNLSAYIARMSTRPAVREALAAEGLQ